MDCHELSLQATQHSSYLTVLAALPVCTNSIPLQSAGGSIAAGIHTFLQMEKKKKKKANRETECKWGGTNVKRNYLGTKRSYFTSEQTLFDFVISGAAGLCSIATKNLPEDKKQQFLAL